MFSEPTPDIRSASGYGKMPSIILALTLDLLLRSLLGDEKEETGKSRGFNCLFSDSILT
jgi:hypothetical protein